MDQIEKYIEELMEKSTPDRPIWNIEKIMQGLDVYKRQVHGESGDRV